MKAVKIILGILGALGVGLVGLILACHFNPGLSDAIASFLYQNKTTKTAETEVTTKIQAEEDEEDASLLDQSSASENYSDELIAVPTDAALPAEDAVWVPADLKSLADYGLTQENVLNSLDEYFDDCYRQLAAAKGESTEFYNVMRDVMLAEQVLKSYDNESYRAGFMDKFMNDYQVDTCGWNMEEEELQGGYILVKHTMTR